ncbi:DUF6300 family protein [Streptomyces sp. NPDC057681]|uniref:DUF6300 family protein n=1 Tax=Streptomyces sp. NPDC057681 TaxID=3346209 RepID=UPI00369FB082
MAGRHVTNSHAEDILLNLDDVPPCTRCVSEALLRARFGYSWKNASGEIVSGIRTAELCPSCDQGRPAADELLTLLTVDERLGPERIVEFGGLVAAWVESVRHHTVDLQLLDDERLRHGDL